MGWPATPSDPPGPERDPHRDELNPLLLRVYDAGKQLWRDGETERGTAIMAGTCSLSTLCRVSNGIDAAVVWMLEQMPVEWSN